MTAIDDALNGLRKIYNHGIPNDDELDELDNAIAELAQLRERNAELKEALSDLLEVYDRMTTDDFSHGKDGAERKSARTVLEKE